MEINKFEEAAIKERIAFKNLRELYNLFNTEDCLITINPYDGMESYDLIIQYHKNGTIIKRLIIELKIRSLSGMSLQDARDNGWIFEDKKYKSLKKAADLDPDKNVMLYICFTPDGTYIWNITKLQSDFKKHKKVMNKATMSSTDNKINKTVYLLDPKLAHKHYEYRWDDAQYQKEKQLEIINKQRNINILKDDRDMLWDLLKGE